jgi:hypothetical protein
MRGRVALNNLDGKYFWQDKFQNLYALMIPPGQTANTKFLFRKKSKVYRTE